jgi:hypothetical protein
MLTITHPSDANDPEMRRLLQIRFEQLADYDLPITDLASFKVVQAGDDVTWLLTNLVDGRRYGQLDFEPSWETVQRHAGFYEAVFVLDDSGFGHVYLIPDCDGIDRDLLTLCRQHGTNTSDETDSK